MMIEYIVLGICVLIAGIAIGKAGNTEPPAEPKWDGVPIGWYWWKEEGKDFMPLYRGPGAFGNDCFKPGLGWCLANRIGGEWGERIPYPDE